MHNLLNVFTKLKWLSSLLVVIALFISFVNLSTSYAEFTPTFDQNTVLKDYDIYSYSRTTDINATGSYTGILDSKEKIETFLCARGSILCNKTIQASLYNIGNNYYLNQLSNLTFDPGSGYKAIEGQNMLVSEAIWRLSRTNVVQGCLDSDNNTCFDNSQTPLNPGFLISFIQKESRLISGSCAKADSDTNPSCSYSDPGSIQKLNFRSDRALGYFCFETSDKTNSCWDENPNWVIYKGLFRQMYHAMRRIKVLQNQCRLGGSYSFKNSNGDFRVGNNVTLDGITVTLKNDITCALYIYTPHVSNLLWSVMYSYAVLGSIFERYNIPENYIPLPLFR